MVTTGDGGRAGHIANPLPDGTVLVVGGVGANSSLLNSTELYDTSTGTWTDAGDLPGLPRSGHTQVLLEDGRVLVAAGWGGLAVNLDDAFVFDGQWTTTGSLNNARFGHASSLLPDGTVLVAGGTFLPCAGCYSEAVTAVEIYHPDTGEWQVVDDRPVVPNKTVLLDNGTVLFFTTSSRPSLIYTP